MKFRKIFGVTIVLNIFLFSFYNNLFSVEQFPLVPVFSGYFEDGFVIFINPAGEPVFSKINFVCRYGNIFSAITENQIDNTDMVFSYSLNNLNLGFGYRGIFVSQIYSEELLMLNFNTKLLNEKLHTGINFKSYIYKYILDDYYLNDFVANNTEPSINLDLGFRYKIAKNFFTALSYRNILKQVSGNVIKYTIPQEIIFGLGYNYLDTKINLELVNKAYEISTKNYNYNIYRFGIQQTVFDMKQFSTLIILGVDKGTDFTNFFLSPSLILSKFGLEIQYLWSYPVTNIKDYFGNHFVTLKCSLGKKHFKEQKTFGLYEDQQIKIDTEKNKLKQTVVSQEQQIIELKQKIEQIKQEQKVLISTVVISQPVQPVIQKQKIEKFLKPETIFVKPKFPLAHTVTSGETLISIAEKYYNNKDYWTKIYNANKDKIIKGVPVVGETIIIPEP